ncbi:PREDICTED: cyclin-dependent kinase inhibitor 7-like isoform X2 [Nicotiana attenuata]|uniref:Cyclin-dependent kinase inhibitor n=1 Tax=Nicotiana attenuata TaxID=49451 RepID=A0A1J6J8U1_NICAT|nr:PREDICTED: cyclin-dependent kinase inhibitor 7-like isoform X2 [Nicotiana attenuata]OIT07235.1 cyclin-dependent kinase inhibitor 7 [Nicotiana attenuata]
MGDFLRKCEKIREMKVMEIGHGGSRTREDVEVISSSLSSSKRRKFDAASNVDFSENSASPATSVTSVHIPTNSQCSSTCYESGEVVKSNLKSLDLKAEGFETDNSASFNGGYSVNFKPIDQPNPPTEHCGDSEEMESLSTTTKKSSSSAVSAHRKPPSAAKVPSEVEIEEFFSVAEKREQKRFAEKYNYDIAKDVPLKGRYQWVILKP